MGDFDTSNFVPPDVLQHTESPLKWVQVIKDGNMLITNNLTKMNDYANQGESYTFEKFVSLLIISFEYALEEDFEQAKIYLKKLDELLMSWNKEEDRVYSRIGPAMGHIYLSTKTAILFVENELSAEVEVLMEQCRHLKPLSEMNSVVQAGIHAVKAKFYMSCSTQTKLALENMKEATRLDSTFALWKYWTGKFLRKIRRDENKNTNPAEELECFEDAVQTERDAKYVVFLAQAYREKANYLFKNQKAFPGMNKDDLNKEIDDLNNYSSELYMESVDLNPNSAVICRRAGNGLMTLPERFAKYRLAKQLLHKAEKLSENPVTFHILGTYYFRYEEDTNKAVEYFEKTVKSNMMYGYHELIRIKYMNDPDYDALEDLLAAEKALRLSIKLHNIQGDIGWYYLVFQNNLHKALEYFWKIIQQDENCVHLKIFYSYSFLVTGPLNIYRVLKDKILELKDEEKDEIITKFLDKVNNNPALLDTCSECISLQRAQSEALNCLKWQRKKQQQRKKRFEQSNKMSGVQHRKETFQWTKKAADKEINWRNEKKRYY